MLDYRLNDNVVQMRVESHIEHVIRQSLLYKLLQ